ncbi:hypothetical protein KAR04_02550 [Candidatus Calescamantes bacterium]|nr:hypothetical protein [Candidatus Calescamantes bacterium]MCK5599084.1 hypothetical protein [bacterium]
MKKYENLLGSSIIASATIWAAVITGCAFVLKGTGMYGKISNILIGGSVAHVLFIWAPIGIQIKKLKESKGKVQKEVNSEQ